MSMIKRWGKVPTAWGVFYASWDEGGLLSLRFPDEPPPEGPLDRAPILAALARELEEYFQGVRREFSLPLQLLGTHFQVSVWRALLGIPYGTTVTYGELARRVGRPRAARAVGGACGANPLPIIVPCHRVLPLGGGLGAFRAGSEWKRRLLELEGNYD
jgi:O-6-methylguanine DNA methyltransferase